MKNALNNKAFTLFELIVVIVLIAILYGVFVGKLSQKSVQNSQITLDNLKESLKNIPFEKEILLSCQNPPAECSVFIDGKKLDGSVKLFEEKPVVYLFDEIGKPKIIDFAPEFDKQERIKDICFSFFIRKNGASPNFIVDRQGVFYIFKALEQKPMIFDNFEKAIEAFDHSKLLPITESDYNFN